MNMTEMRIFFTPAYVFLVSFYIVCFTFTVLKMSRETTLSERLQWFPEKILTLQSPKFSEESLLGYWDMSNFTKQCAHTHSDFIKRSTQNTGEKVEYSITFAFVSRICNGSNGFY